MASSSSVLNPQDVISFILLNTGRITNHDLVRNFRHQLKDPQLGEENKRLLKSVTGKVAQVEKQESGIKTINIKPRYEDKSASEIYSEYLYQCATKDEFNVFVPKSEDAQQHVQDHYDVDVLKQKRRHHHHDQQQQHRHHDHHSVEQQHEQQQQQLQQQQEQQQQEYEHQMAAAKKPPKHHHRYRDHEEHQHHHDIQQQQQQQQQQEMFLSQKPPKLPPRKTDNASSSLGKPPPLPEKKTLQHKIAQDDVNMDTPRRLLTKEGHVLFKKQEFETPFERSSFRRKTVKDKSKKKKYSVPNLHSSTQEVDVDAEVFAKAQSDQEDETTTRIKSKRKKFQTAAQKSVKDLTKDFDELATTSQLKLTDHIKDGKHQTSGNRNLLKRSVKQQSKLESNWGPLPKNERQWILAASRNDSHTMEKMITRSMAAVRDPLNGYTALHWSAKHGNVKMIKRLLTFGASVNQGSRGGYTPLMLAAMTEREVAYQFLLSVPECNPNVRDYSGKRALDYALKKKSSETGSTEENSSEVGYDADEDDTDSGGKRKRIMQTVDRSSSFLRGMVVRESGRRGNSRDGHN